MRKTRIKSKPTGLYEYCPKSALPWRPKRRGPSHGPFAGQVLRGGKAYWCACVCGVRQYWPKSEKAPSGYTREQVVASGGIILEDLVAVPPELLLPPEAWHGAEIQGEWWAPPLPPPPARRVRPAPSPAARGRSRGRDRRRP